MLSALRTLATTRVAAPLRTFVRTYKVDADRQPVIVSFARTPIGSFSGSLSSLSAPKLGSIAVKEAVARAGLKPEQIEAAYIGNVVSAGLGQAPARQAALGAGLPVSVQCTTINKVCSSGMKCMTAAAQSIMLGDHDIMVVGGMESMTNTPFVLPGARAGFKYGDQKLQDSLSRDGLADAYTNEPMGVIGDIIAAKYKFTREQHDAYALESYARAIKAQKEGYFDKEIVPVVLPSEKKGGAEVVVSKDEEPGRLRADKIPTLKAAFSKNGIVTAATSSKLSDGASAFVLMSAGKAKELGITPLAKILGYADAEREPYDFPITPADAIPRALEKAGIKQSDVDYYEINEAFGVVGLANMQILGIKHEQLNVWGGAISLGHPIGSSGSRITGTLLSILQRNNKSIGVAAICNGGGGASAIVIQRI